MKSEKLPMDTHELELTNLNKVLFPDDGITKGDLIDYYRRISKFMLPHMSNRPVTMHRFPDGIKGESFFQQNISDYFPNWIDRITINKKEGGKTTHLLCNNEATLVYMANLACITPHIWLSRADRLNYPDKIVIDLDPTAGFEQVRSAAVHIKETADQLGLRSFVMLTGSRGLHVIFPISTIGTFEENRSFSQELGRYLISQYPDLFTIEQYKDNRHSRVFLDTLRNSYGQTSVSPYAVRAKPGAPVAAPIDWKELENKNINSRYYNMKSMLDRIGHEPDPWKGILDQTQSLEKPTQLLRDLLKS